MCIRDRYRQQRGLILICIAPKSPKIQRRLTAGLVRNVFEAVYKDSWWCSGSNVSRQTVPWCNCDVSQMSLFVWLADGSVNDNADNFSVSNKQVIFSPRASMITNLNLNLMSYSMLHLSNPNLDLDPDTGVFLFHLRIWIRICESSETCFYHRPLFSEYIIPWLWRWFCRIRSKSGSFKE